MKDDRTDDLEPVCPNAATVVVIGPQLTGEALEVEQVMFERHGPIADRSKASH